MTTNIIVAFFKETKNSIDAAYKLKELEAYGYISVDEIAIFKKDSNGNISVIKNEILDGIDSLVGMSEGILVGALAGPVGLLAGILLGTITTTIFDYKDSLLSLKFVTKFQENMLPNTLALIIEVEEENIDFIDQAFKSLEGIFFRTSLKNVKKIHMPLKNFDQKIAFERKKIAKEFDTDKENIKKNLEKYIIERKKIINQINGIGTYI